MATAVVGEERPGPVLSVLASRQFAFVFLFYTPHTQIEAHTTRTESALKHLEGYAWPGNVRELKNVLQRSVLNAKRDVLETADITVSELPHVPGSLSELPDPEPGFSLTAFLSAVRRHLMLRALQKSGNNQAQAAKLLGISKEAVNQFVRTEAVDNPD